MAMGQLQAFLTPDPLHLLVIDLPAFELQKPGDLAVAITAILFCQPDQGQAQSLIIVFAERFVVLGAAGNTYNSASAPL